MDLTIELNVGQLVAGALSAGLNASVVLIITSRLQKVLLANQERSKNTEHEDGKK